MNATNLLAGLGGAVMLTILNESLKHINGDMPRIDLVGEEAIQKSAAYFGVKMDNKETLYEASLIGDLVSNTAYFSLISGEGKELWTKATSAGFFAGVGAINLPSKIGLDDRPVAKTTTTKAWTIGYYMIGALTTATLVRVIERFQNRV
jgi:hypothetical protein